MSINIKWNSQHQDDTGFCYVSDLFRLSGSIDHQSGRFLWIAEMGWKHESPDEKRGDSDTRSEAIQAAKDAAVEMLMQEIEVAPQPVSVIVPPIEWIGLDNKGGLRDKESGRKVYFDTYTQKWIGQGLKQYSTREEACESHQNGREKDVKRTLEGCNVIPYRDPQGLVDMLEKIKDTLFKQGYPLNESDSDTFKGMSEDVESVLKEWEDGK